MLNPRPHTVNISAFEAISISEANNEMTKWTISIYPLQQT
jgi:hypothetical protein